MNDWMETFISQCLTDVPPGKYRARTEKELRDHMETQYQVLTGAGASPPEARSRILDTIGDPERLREEYAAAWARTFQGRWALRPNLAAPFFGVCLLTAHLYLLTFYALFKIGFDRSTGPLCLVYPIPNLIFCLAMFLVPTTLGALFLRRCFREDPRPAPWITMGLLTAWTGEKVCMFLLAVFFQYGNRHDRPFTLPAILARTRWCPGECIYLWQPIVYVLASFAGCLVLGQLFGRKTERRRELA